MKYLVPAILLFLILVYYSKTMYYSFVKQAPYDSVSQYPTAELLIAQNAPHKP